MNIVFLSTFTSSLMFDFFLIYRLCL